MELSAGGAASTPESSVGDAFSWAFRDPDWVSKLILMGLIGIIPIVGSLQLLGWMLATLDNLRAGHQVLPHAGFRYATRGLRLFLAAVIYAVVTLAVFYGGALLVVFWLFGVTPHAAQSTSQGAAPFLFFMAMFGAMSVFLAVTLPLFLGVPLRLRFPYLLVLSRAIEWLVFIPAVMPRPRG